MFSLHVIFLIQAKLQFQASFDCFSYFLFLISQIQPLVSLYRVYTLHFNCKLTLLFCLFSPQMIYFVVQTCFQCVGSGLSLEPPATTEADEEEDGMSDIIQEVTLTISTVCFVLTTLCLDCLSND